MILAIVVSLKAEESRFKRSIGEATGRTGVHELWPLDLASVEGARQLAGNVSRELDRVAVLLVNAAMRAFDYIVVEAHESMVKLSVLSHQSP